MSVGAGKKEKLSDSLKFSLSLMTFFFFFFLPEYPPFPW